MKGARAILYWLLPEGTTTRDKGVSMVSVSPLTVMSPIKSSPVIVLMQEIAIIYSIVGVLGGVT